MVRDLRSMPARPRELGRIVLDRRFVAHAVARLPGRVVPRCYDDSTVERAEPVHRPLPRSAPASLYTPAETPSAGGLNPRLEGASIKASRRPCSSGILPAGPHFLVETPGVAAVTRFDGSPRERVRRDVGENPSCRDAVLE